MSADLSRAIKEKAAELGFCRVGIVKAEVLEPERTHLSEWLERRYEGTMAWMSASARKRQDPRAVLPGARSVISVAYNYYVAVEHGGGEDCAKISRYAWGDDYHEILEEKLHVLKEFVEYTRPAAQCKVYVDTGPVMEKALAVRAGIGWLGKHTNVITRDFGSWVFLGELVTDLDLTADDPMGDYCGSCTACIDACPTDAIVEPYVLDARRCISYLTIEHKGDIPREFHSQLDNWVFGCDVCQDVCPWNRFRKEAEDRRFLPRKENREPSLQELGRMSSEAFSKQFSGSPVKRARYSGIMRNVRSIEEGHRIPG